MTKQGSGHSTNSGQKREPIVHGIDPGGVSQIGNMVVTNPEPIYESRGFTAPKPVATTVHHCGSQGEHK